MVTGDLIFFSAVEGLAGAMGHRARQAADVDSIGAPGLTVVDYASLPMPASTLDTIIDPMRTAAFIPHVDAGAFAGARAVGIAHVHRRGALATELPRILALYAADTPGDLHD